MASADSPGYTSDRTLDHERKASPTGAYVATAGVAIFLISVFLDWFSSPDFDEAVSGYNTDGVIPFTAYLGVGLVVALFYAISRARGRQHRGLTLVTMAVGIAAVLLSLSNLFNATGVVDSDVELDVEIGVWIALLGSIVWSVGAGLLAKEPEGDDDWHGARDTLGTGGHRTH
jgi:ABC-type Fe3+-siderophore transport system permease subunit